MPFTPFHLGPPLLISLLFLSSVNLISILVGSVIVDVRAVYCFFTNSCRVHGPFHTLLGGLFLTLPTILLVYYFRNFWKKLLNSFGLEQNFSTRSIILGAVVGVISHVILDSVLYSEVNLLYPFTGNPFYGLTTPGIIYTTCLLSFVISIPLVVYRVKN